MPNACESLMSARRTRFKMETEKNSYILIQSVQKMIKGEKGKATRTNRKKKKSFMQKSFSFL